jgi:hypothetical protein
MLLILRLIVSFMSPTIFRPSPNFQFRFDALSPQHPRTPTKTTLFNTAKNNLYIQRSQQHRAPRCHSLTFRSIQKYHTEKQKKAMQTPLPSWKTRAGGCSRRLQNPRDGYQSASCRCPERTLALLRILFVLLRIKI